MHVHFVKTTLVDDTKYIDVCFVDGKMYTFLMHKTEEPNVFSVLKQEEGDTSETINT